MAVPRSTSDEFENYLNSSFGGYPHAGQGNPSGLPARRGLGGIAARPNYPLPTEQYALVDKQSGWPNAMQPLLRM